jgi:hypothetical protein
MSPILRRLLYVIAAASMAVIGFATFHLATSRASASPAPDPLQGISAAEKAPLVTPSAAVLAQLRDPSGDALGGAILSSVRLLPTAIAGHAAYVMPSTYGDVCLFVEAFAEACGIPLTATTPALYVSFDPGGTTHAGTTAFGIAEDGVASVTLTVNGSPVTVPVKGNTFAFTGGPSVASDDITAVATNFADGHSVKLGSQGS